MGTTPLPNKILSQLLHYVGIAFGALFAAMAIRIFLIPNQLIDGGVVGISLIFARLWGNAYLSYFLLVLNIPFIYLAYRYIRRSFVLHMFVAIVLFALFLSLLENAPNFVADPLEAIVIGGAMLGAGAGLIIRNGGCTDGTEILAILINRKKGFTVSQVIFLKENSAGCYSLTMQDLVELVKISPRILLDIRYATAQNFTGQAVYSSSRCFLRRKTAQRLHRVQTALEKKGLGLKVFDGYRPLSVQKIFWALVPDPRYVADPAEGSRHNRGASVDLTLVDAEGRDLPMPTEFDDFTERASHLYQGGSKESLFNRERLKKAMETEGFIPYEREWWHYDDPDWQSYPIVDILCDA